MPIFEYKCEECGTRFEKLVRRSTGTEGLACPSCGQPHLSLQFSTFATHAGRATAKPEALPPCAGGMCPTPDLCGRN